MRRSVLSCAAAAICAVLLTASATRPHAQSATPNCGTPGSSVTCTVPVGIYTQPLQQVQPQTLGTLTITIPSNTTFNLTNPPNGYGINFVTSGAAGSITSQNGTAGQGAGSLTATIGGAVNLSLTETPASATYAVLLQSLGGTGGQAGNKGYNGGSGGSASGTLTANNSAAITFTPLTGPVLQGGGAFEAQSIGGNGGNVDNGQVQDGTGGFGGAGGAIQLSNSGAITLGSTAAPLLINQPVNAVAAESLGGLPGSGGKTAAATGGGGGSVSVSNSGAVNFTWAPNSEVSGNFTYGVLARSQGAGGGNGEDSGVNGSAGGGGGAASVNLTLGGNVSLTEAQVYSGVSQFAGSFIGAAVAALSSGAGGGMANEHATGGQGGSAGSASVGVTDASVMTQESVGSGLLPAIRAESIGGAGGPSDASQSGSSGGSGGGAGNILVTISTTLPNPPNQPISQNISTDALHSPAINAASKGGNGANGSDFDPGIFGAGGSGGNGGAGGGAGTATVNVGDNVAVTTAQPQSTTILAVSGGGNGGTGGLFGGGVVGNGGNGGAGGNASDVTVTVGRSIVSAGQPANAVIGAISVGGAGGTGGYSGDPLSADGGNGGAGGSAGKVTVTIGSGAKVTAFGQQTYGIWAQSAGNVGGAGGNANSVVSGPGAAGAGGNASDVSVSNAGQISTLQPESIGILAQSISGGGGSGGMALTGFYLQGTNGGTAGTTGTAGVTNTGFVGTFADASTAIIVQSIGGSGGAGGSASGGAISIGGNAGSSTDGSTAAATIGGTVETQGASSTGVLVQSIGGGGGAAGGAVADGVGIGGSGSAGGNGSTVTVTATGLISTTGAQSPGLLVQSIGGGGGTGGNSDSFIGIGASGASTGNAGSVTVTAQGSITTGGDQSYGMLVQSIGGGGGAGGNASQGLVTVGGSASGGGIGQDATINASGAVTTQGDLAHGILGMSIGGGGGVGGNATSYGAVVGVAIGGTAGGGGNAGTMTVNAGPGTNVQTYGSNAMGIAGLSVGGGGGLGGSGYTITGSTGFGASLALGGSGGSGGTGNTSAVNLNGARVTTGLATLDAVDPASLPDGSPIPVLPISAYGVVALSVGGGGGAGGSAMAKTYTLDLPTEPKPGSSSFAISTSFAVGGSGGSGGDGGSATVNASNGTNILTYGNDSHAIAAESVGGGGGNGGDASAMATSFGFKNISRIGIDTGGKNPTFAPRPNYNLDLSVTTGGTGGSAGDGGATQVTVGGTSLVADPGTSLPVAIQTLGDYAYGVRAQSIGGGGGNAGTGAGSTQNGTAAGTALTASITVGASGGGGGMGGAVTVDQFANSTIATAGDTAYGILAQSIGGGGGTSTGGSYQFGFPSLQALSLLGIAPDRKTTFDRLNTIFGGIVSTATIKVGTDGAGGGDGGTVSVLTNGTVSTTGEAASAIVAQSVGGGGGVAGSAGSTASSDNPTVIQDLKTGKLLLNQLAAYPIDALNFIAETGEAGTGLLLNLKDLFPSFNLNLSFGGTGGSGGNGGTVTATADGAQISTLGDYASDIEAQSVGKGGGTGGGAVAGGSSGFGNILKINANFALGGSGGGGGTGGPVTVSLGGTTLSTTGYAAYNVFAQSIGGGGGTVQSAETNSNGVFSLGASVSNNSATGGDGGTVTLTQANPNVSTLTTTGDTAHAVFLQSIGGGGGVAGDGYSAAASFVGLGGSSDTFKAGGAGSYGNGGNITFDATNLPYLAITTLGQNSYGILAQSIGGGGGLVFTNPGVVSTNIVGGTSTSATLGGAISITLQDHSSIVTVGNGSYAILAQSVGGGGGITGYASGPALLNQATSANSGGAVTNGSGGTISITTGNSTIQTIGGAAHGIFAQSIGGGGGIAAGSDGSSIYAGSTGAAGSTGTGGTITINQSGTLLAPGTNSVGILAQSVGPNGGGIITVNVNGTVIGGSGPQGYGVWVIGGETFSNVNIASGASVGSVGGTSGVAVTYTGSTTLNVTNYGTMIGSVSVAKTSGNGSGTIFNYGTWETGAQAAGDVQNAGLIVVGPRGGIATTAIIGNLTQSATGSLLIDADFNSRSADLVTVAGNAMLSGTVTPVITSVLPGIGIPIITVQGSVTGSLTATPSALFDYDVSQVGNQLLLRASSADFNPTSFGLPASRAVVAEHLQDIWDHGGSAQFGQLFALLGNTADVSPNAYSAQLRQLSPDAAFAPGARGLGAAMNFANNTLSCPQFDGTTAMLVEGRCAWMRVTGRATSQDSGNGITSYNLNSMTWQIGGQTEFAPGWLIGGSLAYEDSWLSTSDSMTSGNGQAGYGAVTLKYQTGPWLFAASAFGGAGQFNTSRIITLPGFASVAKGSPDTANFGLLLRTAYTIGREEFYLRPNLSLTTVNVRSGAYQEGGAGSLNLHVNSASQTTLIASPMLELGGRIALPDDMILRPYMTAGVSFLSNDSWKQTAFLVGAPAGTGAFPTTIPMDPVVGRVGVGVQLYTSRQIDFRLQYDGEFSHTTVSHAGSLVASLRF